jgi:hypothetical protein
MLVPNAMSNVQCNPTCDQVRGSFNPSLYLFCRLSVWAPMTSDEGQRGLRVQS